MSLMAYYQHTFSLMQHYNYSLSEIDTLIPWEKEVYTDMLVDFIKEEREREQQESRRNG